MPKAQKTDHRQASIFDFIPEPAQQNDNKPLLFETLGSDVVIPLELDTNKEDQPTSTDDLIMPAVPARWEAVRTAAEHKNVLPVLLKQIRRVESLDYLEYLITLSKDEGYVWLVYGEAGSGKSTFFHTLEYQTNNRIRKHIINGNSDQVDLSSQTVLSSYLTNVIRGHKEQYGETTPLIIVLEERENSMTDTERSSIAQALRNVLRPPGPGRNVIFVLPIVNSNQGTLFLDQVKATGVAVPLGHNAIYTFHGPGYTQHVDIFIDLFMALNDRDISDFGIQRSTLQAHVSSQQTVGQFIRTIREEIVRTAQKATRVIRSHNYKQFTVIFCFVNPVPNYSTEPIVKAMTMDALGRLRTGEILRVTQSQRAQRWENNRQALANIVSALDMRIVEVPPEIISKLIYAYQWQTSDKNSMDELILPVIERNLYKAGIDFNAPKAVRQNLRQQLGASNLFRIIANEETKSYPTPRYSNQDEARKARELAEITLTRLVCEVSHSRQRELHHMFAQALDDLLQNNGAKSSVANFKAVYPEASLTVTHSDGHQRKVLRPDIVIEMQDKLFLLEFCWRSEEHFTYADIATYVLRKIQESYLNLPLIQALAG